VQSQRKNLLQSKQLWVRMRRNFKLVLHQKAGSEIIFGAEIKFMCESAKKSDVTIESEHGLHLGGNELDKKGSILNYKQVFSREKTRQ
jgi:hypothetical protein